MSIEQKPEVIAGWVIENGKSDSELRYRAMRHGQVCWVNKVEDALMFSRRQDAEHFCEEDEDAWVVRPKYLLPGEKNSMSFDLEGLKDPNTVHILMLRGVLGIPTIRSMVDLRGEVPNGEEVQLLRIAELQEQLDKPENLVLTLPNSEFQLPLIRRPDGTYKLAYPVSFKGDIQSQVILPEELEKFSQTAANFEENLDVLAPEKLLLRWANFGLIETDKWVLSVKGNRLVDCYSEEQNRPRVQCFLCSGTGESGQGTCPRCAGSCFVFLDTNPEDSTAPIPENVQCMLSCDGFYILKDPDDTGLSVPVVVIRGRAYSMRLDEELNKTRFYPNVKVFGPFKVED